MKRRAMLLAATAALIGALVAAPAAAAPAPTASTSADTLITAGAKKKLKIGKRIKFSVTCLTACNARVVASVAGPGKVPKITVSGALPAATPIPVILKPNGPLLKALKAFPGRFKLKTKISATDPATGETDTDKKTFRFKR